MPILNLDDEAPGTGSNESTYHNYVPNEEVKAGVIFNKDTDITGIVHYVDGSKWEVDYFIQIRDLNDEPMLPDVNVPNTTLKYNRINKLILNVQDELTNDNPNAPITGKAIINSGIVPNYGDAFKVTLLGGREAIFIVNEVSKKIYDVHEVYNISYTLHVFLDTDTVVYNDLIYKTIKEYVYDKDYLADYSSPIILSTDYKKKIELKEEPRKILNYYINTFLNKDLNVLALPTENSVYVDTLLNDFIFRIVNNDQHPDIININRIEYNNPRLKESVWDVILNRDIDALSYVEQDIGFKYTPTTISNPNTRNIGYLGIKFIVDMLYGTPALDIEIIENSRYDENHVKLLGDDKNGYIFSDSFYNNIISDGILEQALLNYLKGELITDEIITSLIDSYSTWSRMEQFYLIPVLLILIADKVSATYKSI